MHKPDLVAAIADAIDLPKDKTNDIVSVIFDEITQALSRNDSVAIPGFGSFSQRHRAERMGRSPKTGEEIKIAASTTVGFKAGKALKLALND